jgi:hypothetical protein
MTEQEWFACTDPEPMLEFLGESGRASERKLRLFAVACCRRVWHLLKDERSEGAVEVLELLVEGKAGREKLMAAHEAAGQAWGTPARTAVYDASALEWEVGQAAKTASHAAWAGVGGSRADERKGQADLLRCVASNPFRPLLSLNSSVLAWNDGIAVRMARAIYEKRQLPAGTLDPASLAVLADAVEEAGCMDAELLGHLRGPGPHVRGCWVVDWLLGRG